ncbi:uncharacterized protein LOC129722761 [Wyeomyia smithii]|uniref:uncharacterized protein LOC129722761 n=1 Tax=Wyeomyia smithii TaxID=174621 RepID=UPI002467EB94|nr:uncharacterized protein LOC129722761 [Wyeomyia smithii]
MDSENNPETLQSCRSLLSGNDLLAHYVATYELNSCFERLVLPEEELAHQDQIIRLKEEFRQILAQQRVDREEAFSKGEWEADRKRVRVVKAFGKYNVFGYQQDKQLYLQGYEALHLMEMKRLIVYWDTVIVSMEQAYVLFLGYPDSLDLEEYLVYSMLMRTGFYLLKFDANRIYQSHDDSSKTLDEYSKCVWRNLYDMLNQPNPLLEETENSLDLEQYNDIRRSMLSFGNKIMSPTKPEVFEQSKSKRKRVNSDHETNVSHDIKDTTEQSYECKLKQFSDLFESFDVIKSSLVNLPTDENEESSQLKLSFDMFTADGSVFRKSFPPAPEHRILVSRSNQPLPTAGEIGRLFQGQPEPLVPILMFRVSDTLSLSCFLYCFTKLPSNLVAVRYPGCSIQRKSVETEDVHLN